MNNSTYTYQGVPCEVTARFSGDLVQIRVSGEIRTVNKTQVVENTNKVVVLNQQKTATQSTDAAITRPNEPSLFALTDEKLNINEATQAEIAELKGIGKLSARTIIKNKPEGGYQDIEQLKSLNTILERINWDLIEPTITF
jgi:DNA uptake protein ComE-like DNA-binding protein